jgi:hypothetical protein
MALYFAAIGFYIQIMMVITWSNNNFAVHYKRSVARGSQRAWATWAGLISSNIYPTNEGPRFVKGYSISLALCMLLGVLVFAFFVGLKESNRRRRAGRKEFRLSISSDAENIGDCSSNVSIHILRRVNFLGRKSQKEELRLLC